MNKSLLAAIASTCTAFGLFAADGDSFTYQGLNYTVLSEEEKTCEVGVNTDASGDVVIPPAAKNGDTEYKVIALGADAFFANIPMTSISIPETVTTIRSQALSRCMGLEELVIPNSVTEMESRAVYACYYLERLTLSSGLREIRRETFSGNPWLDAIVIPDGVESIGREAFSYCGKLGEVTLEESDTPISFDTDAFGQTKYIGAADDPVAKIVTLNINRTFTCTSDDATLMPFAHKPSLTAINIGAQVRTLPESAFAACDAVEKVNVSSAECPTAFASTFSDATYRNAVLAVPRFCDDKYKATAPWSKFSTIEDTLPEVGTGVESIETDGFNAARQLYDLSGRRVSTPAHPGIYIVRHPDGTVTKALLNNID